MYSLRKVNNMYEGGSRSDFVVLGHPEFCLGKAGADRGYGPKWDTTSIPTYPKRGAAISRLRSAGSEQLLKRLTVELGAKPAPQARARTKKQQEEERGSVANPDVRGNFEAFLSALRDLGGEADWSHFRRRSMDDAPAQLSYDGRLTTGFLNSIKEAGVSKHRLDMHEGLLELADKYKSNPKVVERDLLASGSWQYWANELASVKNQRRIKHVKHQRSLTSLSKSQ